jgi:hypothetical protein
MNLESSLKNHEIREKIANVENYMRKCMHPDEETKMHLVSVLIYLETNSMFDVKPEDLYLAKI